MVCPEQGISGGWLPYFLLTGMNSDVTKHAQLVAEVCEQELAKLESELEQLEAEINPALDDNALVALSYVLGTIVDAMKILNRPTPSKKWITKLQILQFATSFLLLGKTLWHYKSGNDCAGMKALLYNCIFNATLIVQFIGVDKRNKVAKKE